MAGHSRNGGAVVGIAVAAVLQAIDGIALKAAFNLAERAGKAVCPLFPTLTVRSVRSGFFEESEFHAVLAGLPEDVKPVAEFAYLTGWRRGEVVRLDWRQVDFRGGVIRLDPGSTKNDEGRVFPFAGYGPLARLLRDQRERTEAVERTPETHRSVGLSS